MRPEKVWAMNQLKSIAQENPVVILTDFTGLSAKALATLRDRLKAVSGAYWVVKDRLFNRAVKETVGADIRALNLGATGIAFGEDVVSVAKVIKTFAGENELFKIKLGLMKDRVIKKDEITALANVPPRSVLLGKLVGTLKGPITGLVYVLKGNLTGLVTLLSKIREQKEEAEKKV